MAPHQAWPQSHPIELDTRGGRARLLGLPQVDLIAQSVASHGGFESGLADLAIQLLASQAPGTVIDVGANIGTFAVPLAMALPQHRLRCFEAQRLVAYQLCGAAAMNGLAHVQVHQLAVGERAGELMVTLPDYAIETNIGALSLDPEVNRLRGATTLGQQELVQMIALDSLHITDLRLLKIDVEGMELPVLRGAAALLERNGFPPLLAECWQGAWFDQHRLQLEAWLSQHGYQLTQMGDNYLAQHPMYPAPSEAA